MKKIAIYSALAVAGMMACSEAASAQNYAIKAYDNLGVGKVMNIDHRQPGQSSSTSYNAFGLDFGYTFWRKPDMWLEANIGLGYVAAGATFSIPEMSYHYAAPAYADEDGNPYERYYTLTNLKQKSSIGYFNIPLYLQYEYKPLSWLGVHAEVGFGFGFRVAGSVGKVYGMADSYGIFPEYDDLLIDEPYLNDFGPYNLTNAKKGDQTMKGFVPSVMAGVGFEFYAYEPVSFELGVRYNASLTHSFAGKYDVSDGKYTAETAPVTYTVADGTVVKSLADYSSGSRLMPICIRMGVNVRF